MAVLLTTVETVLLGTLRQHPKPWSANGGLTVDELVHYSGISSSNAIAVALGSLLSSKKLIVAQRDEPEVGGRYRFYAVNLEKRANAAQA